MSEIRVLGAERAMMRSPHGAGLFVKGSAYIDARLAQGWTIVESERNHLLPHRFKQDEIGSQEKSGSTVVSNEPFEHEPVEQPQSAEVQGNRRKRRSQRH